MTRVGIVILSWNGGAQTLACIESALAQTHRDRFILVVDNASAASERQTLQAHYPDGAGVEFCWLEENRGYAGGNNVGIAATLARGADLVLILTQDAALAPDALRIMVDTAAADPRIGIVGPQVVDAHDRARVLSIGERVHVGLLCVPRTLLRYRRGTPPWYDVSGVLGCAFVLTRRCVEDAGCFDESLFAYYEEVDLCLRVRRQGFRIVCNPQAVVSHDGMRGFLAGFTPLSAALKARNLLQLMRRWGRPLDWLVLLPTYAMLLAGSLMLYAARGRLDIVGALLRGTVAGMRGRSGPLPTALRAS